MSSIDFHTSSKLKPEDFIQYCSNNLNIDAAEFSVNDICSNKFYIEYQILSGEFNAWYETYLGNDKFNDIENSVDFLKGLSSKYNLQILTPEDDHNPYLFILIEPNGICCTIEVDWDPYDNRNEMNFGRYWNAPFGTIALKNKIDEHHLKMKLFDIFGEYYSDLCIDYYNQDFFIKSLQSKSFAQKLFKSNFWHHYFITPKGKQNWYSVKEKVCIFTEGIRKLSNSEHIEVCLFPADYSIVENIPGGSDSEEYCIQYFKDKEKRTIYKKRRKSW